VYEELEQASWDLKTAQTECSVEFPVHLSREAGGMVEQWVNGVSWRELCRDTSLDQGDLCRMLRRTVEVLRQVRMIDIETRYIEAVSS
jgi:superfamily II RNA helicase